MDRAQAHAPLPENARLLLRFPHPAPARRNRARVLPVFLPFAGCPQRCIYCNQPAQTGARPEPLETIHARLAETLAAQALAAPAHAEPADGPAPELAFYGGTFTALPAPWPERFLELAQPYLERGSLSRVRCSTRPDAVTTEQLCRLRRLGLSLVELGVQSFNDNALAASGRGYTGQTAQAACGLVRAAGLALGVQLMPGMPGMSPQAFRDDAAMAAHQEAELARLYPCLVLEGTPLADLWRAGGYTPWPLQLAAEELAAALLVLWAGGARVGRIGLAEEPGLRVLAGPRHPALGQMARARALQMHVARLAAGLPMSAPRPNLLLLPRGLQGEALGQSNTLAKGYADLGLAIKFRDVAELALAVA
ncbi:radical SAM protein [Humidesulfovibrio idahonensis]